MKGLLVAVLLFGIQTGNSQVLRLSEVVKEERDDAERMTHKGEDWEEELFVKKLAVVTDSDVAKAYPVSQGGHWTVSVELNEKGGEKMKAATGKLKPGVDRIAIIVDGELVSAPILLSVPLGAMFVIQGNKDMDGDGARDLARKISGLPPLKPGEAAPPDQLPEVEYVPYTEEEYQQRKAEREKMGIFHLEWIPSEEELDRKLRKGMSRDEVEEVLGKPTMWPMEISERRYSLNFELAPEKVPDNPERKMIPNSVQVEFADGKVMDWSLTWSSQSRELKIKGQLPGILEMTLPEMDLSTGTPDIIGYIEEVIISDPNQEVNRTDLAQLASMGYMLESAVIPDQRKPDVSAHCDLIKEMARHFPEVAELRKKAEQGRIDIEALSEVLEPYTFGTKPLPLRKEKEE